MIIFTMQLKMRSRFFILALLTLIYGETIHRTDTVAVATAATSPQLETANFDIKSTVSRHELDLDIHSGKFTPFRRKALEEVSSPSSSSSSCYRTVTFLVDQTSSNGLDLRVTRTTDGATSTMDIPFSLSVLEFGDDPHLMMFLDNYRSFNISLPGGSDYEVTFRNDAGESIWPKFVLPKWDGIPQCNGYVTTANLTIIEPTPARPQDCDELISNGDVEFGTSNWYHMNNKPTTSKGGLIAAEGEGLDGSTALKYFNRIAKYRGPGQNLDIRCLHQNLNSFYEIEVYFRLERESVPFPFICDPYTEDISTRCPILYFRKQMHVYEELQTIGENAGPGRIGVVIPNDSVGFNLLHGVFKVDESFLLYERVFMFLTNVDKKFDILIDNVSVKKMDLVCGADLIRNGNFEENGKFWTNYGVAKIAIENQASPSPPNNKYLKIYDMVGADRGAMQYLYINKDCFQHRDRYAITGEID